MDDKELLALKGEINQTHEEILKQVKHYLEMTTRIRKMFLEYFLNSKMAETVTVVTEHPKEDEQFLEYNFVSSLIQDCFIEEQELITIARSLAKKGSLSLAEALDSWVLNSKLGLRRNKYGYAYIAEQPYAPNAKQYMQQLLYALNIYRLSLSILDLYHRFTVHPCLNTKDHQEALDKSIILGQQLTNPEHPDPIMVSWNEAKQIKRRLDQLRSEIQQFTMDLLHTLKTGAEQLRSTLKEGSLLLQEAYKESPNNAFFSRFLVDQQWQRMLKIIANDMYLGQYSSSSYSGTLTITVECPEALLKTITKFQQMIEEQLPILKKELLKRAYTQANECLTNLKIEASCKGVSLVETQTTGFFKQNEFFYSGVLSLLTRSNKSDASKNSVSNESPSQTNLEF